MTEFEAIIQYRIVENEKLCKHLYAKRDSDGTFLSDFFF